MNLSESDGRPPGWLGAEASDLRGEAQGAGLAHPGEERLLGKPNSSLPVQCSVSCLLNCKYKTNWCVGLVDFLLLLLFSCVVVFFSGNICGGFTSYLS